MSEYIFQSTDGGQSVLPEFAEALCNDIGEIYWQKILDWDDMYLMGPQDINGNLVRNPVFELLSEEGSYCFNFKDCEFELPRWFSHIDSRGFYQAFLSNCSSRDENLPNVNSNVVKKCLELFHEGNYVFFENRKIIVLVAYLPWEKISDADLTTKRGFQEFIEHSDASTEIKDDCIKKLNFGE